MRRTSGRTPGLAGSWFFVVAAATLASFAFHALGLPSPVLFGALVGAMAYALSGRTGLEVPARAFSIGQGLVGATIGALVSLSTLRTLGDDGIPILAVTVATLLLSVLAGQVLRLHRGVSATTGAFAMVAGGASGITALARDLGADDRVVTIVQYLRVLLVLLAMPIITSLVFRPPSGRGSSVPDHSGGWAAGLAFTVLALGGGLVLARYARVPAGSLLGPLLVAVVLAVSGLLGDVSVPVVLQNLGYALIGIQVGLRFTLASLRSIARMLPLAVALIVAVIAACAGMGSLLATAAGVSQLDGYLATTPGGLYAVLATAVDSGSDVTFVLAVQVIRVFAMLLAAPLLARVLRGRGG